jgi:ubiquinone/menaquinone biosynthesis C-methylase UbiE
VTGIADLNRRFYPDYVDEHVRLDRLVRGYLRPGIAVLDAGAGRGIRHGYDYAEVVGRLVGVDLNPAVMENPNVTEAVIADLASLPLPSEEFDLVFSKFAFEHLNRPLAVMRELRRVMKVGSHLLIQTPNR